MDALILFSCRKGGDSKGISRRIHYDFLLKTSQIFDNVHLYGPSEPVTDLSPLKFSSSRDYKKLLNYFEPDVVLVFSYFSCAKWMPIGFCDNKRVPKICIEVDYWNIADKKWYVRNNFDFIIQRGYYKKSVIESVWLPFSCSENLLNDVPITKRKKRIAFVGRGFKSSGTHYYPIRKKVISKLKREGLIEVLGTVGHKNYPEALQKHYCYLSETGRVKSPPAKTFEIIGSGALLMTTQFRGQEDLFGKDPCFALYTSSGVVKTAKQIYKTDNGRIQRIVDRGVECIKQKHLDAHRLEELEYLLSVYLKEKRIVRKWRV